jgi:hypothetical protein
MLALFVGYRKWGIDTSSARAGVVGLLVLTTVVAAFTMILIVIGAFTWMDYRNEECDLTDKAVHVDFRTRPRTKNLLRWYETYVLAFILISLGIMWLLGGSLLLPTMN